MNEDSKSIIAWCAVGLGNKICTLLGAVYWAQKLNYDINILWLLDNHCQCPYTDIYESYSDKLILEIDYAKSIVACNNSFPCTQTLSTFLNTPVTREAKNHYMKLYLRTLKDKIPSTEVKLNFNKIANYKLFLYQNSILDPEIEILEATNILSQLLINKNIYDKAFSFIKKNKIDYNVRGIAIRKTDVPLKTYENFYYKIISENPDTVFFVTSDDCSIKDLFSHFKNVLIYRSTSHALWDGKNIYREKDFVIDSFIEMLILAHTNLYRINSDIKSTFYFCAILYNLIYTGFDSNKIKNADSYKKQLLINYLNERG